MTHWPGASFVRLLLPVALLGGSPVWADCEAEMVAYADTRAQLAIDVAGDAFGGIQTVDALDRGDPLSVARLQRISRQSSLLMREMKLIVELLTEASPSIIRRRRPLPEILMNGAALSRCLAFLEQVEVDRITDAFNKTMAGASWTSWKGMDDPEVRARFPEQVAQIEDYRAQAKALSEQARSESDPAAASLIANAAVMTEALANMLEAAIVVAATQECMTHFMGFTVRMIFVTNRAGMARDTLAGLVMRQFDRDLDFGAIAFRDIRGCEDINLTRGG